MLSTQRLEEIRESLLPEERVELVRFLTKGMVGDEIEQVHDAVDCYPGGYRFCEECGATMSKR